MNGFFDSHAHYEDEAFHEDRDDLLTAMLSDNVSGILCAGSTAQRSAACVALAQRYDRIWAAVGIHPEEAADVSDDDWAQILRLLQEDRVVAVGEIGLDYHYEDACPREKQLYWFERQLALACEKDLPVVIHDREAHEDTYRLLRRYRPRGVLHCFSGSVELLHEAVKLGLYIGLGGAVTFKNARRPVEAAMAVPANRLLLETDAPYMAPVPFRGKRCCSSMLAQTAAKIAELRGVTTEELASCTAQNACRLFGISLP